MNRRQALKSFFVLGGGIVAGFAGYKAYHIFKAPDIGYLESNAELLGALAETILPKTDTPGAKEAGVGNYIMQALRNADKKTQNNFIDGLKDLQDYCNDKFAFSFQYCQPGQQIKALAHMQEKTKLYNGNLGKAQKKYMGNTFFTTLKELTVYGYCTSMQGVKSGLAYDYIPGAFKGCIDILPGQKSWATK